MGVGNTNNLRNCLLGRGNNQGSRGSDGGYIHNIVRREIRFRQEEKILTLPFRFQVPTKIWHFLVVEYSVYLIVCQVFR